MWPRTPEERARNRNTGFVCFCDRSDAESAFACDETDPFNVGRRIMMRWGKNVKNAGVVGAATIIRKKKPPGSNDEGAEAATGRVDPSATVTATAAATGTGSKDTAPAVSDAQMADAIRVKIPADQMRAHFISAVASFVAKDGSTLERALLERERGNPKFSFMQWPASTDDDGTAEHIYYKWRVYAYCQGDTFYKWRTEPFLMTHRSGRAWIPPPLDQEAARLEEEAERAREEAIERQKEERKLRNAKRDYMTGRQLEQLRKGGPDGGAKLEPADLNELNRLFRDRLCANREAICEAMAFCFEQSGAARQISSVLEELLVEPGPRVSVETRVARLYLLSDILFNSQQPGVKNAFLYRDAIERMAPKVFESLGKHGGGKLGRMTMNKLISAVRTVLNAWADWGVFNPTFLEELFARFEGREIPDNSADTTSLENVVDDVKVAEEGDDAANNSKADQPVRAIAQGTWKTVSQDTETEIERTSGEPSRKDTSDAEEADGEPIEESDDADGEPLGDKSDAEDADGEPLEEFDDADGEPLEEASDAEESDGEPLQEGEEADGEPLEEVEGR